MPITLCNLSARPYVCTGMGCPYWEMCEGEVFVVKHIEARIRGTPDFVLSCMNVVVEDMVNARYIMEEMPAPFNPRKEEPKVSGVIYSTKRGNIIMDDLSKKEKVMQMRYEKKEQDGDV